MAGESKKYRLGSVSTELQIKPNELFRFVKSKDESVVFHRDALISQEVYNLARERFGKNPEFGNRKIGGLEALGEMSGSGNSNTHRQEMPEEERGWKFGRMRSFRSDKGYGFVKEIANRKEYFVHISQMLSKEVSEAEYAIFKLRFSRRKRGDIEAMKLFRLSEFKEDESFLKKLFEEHDDRGIREEILKAIPIEEAIKLLEDELNQFSSLNNEKEYQSFMLSMSPFISRKGWEEYKQGIMSLIDVKAEQIASDDVLMMMWLDGVRTKSPGKESIMAKFQEADSELKLKIFGAAETQMQHDLIEHLNAYNCIWQPLEFVLSFLSRNGRNTKDDILRKMAYEELRGTAEGAKLYEFTLSSILPRLYQEFENLETPDKQEVFTLVDSKTRRQLVQILITHYSASIVLDIIYEHLKNWVGWRYRQNLRAQLRDENSRKEVYEGELYQYALDILGEKLTPREEFDLFVHDYHNTVSIEYVLNNWSELSTKTIEKVFQVSAINVEDKQTLFKHGLSISMQSCREFLIGQKKVTLRMIEQASDSYAHPDLWSKEEPLGRMLWLLKTVHEYLGEKSLQAYSGIWDSMPQWLPVLFWEKGGVPGVLDENLISFIKESAFVENAIVQWTGQKGLDKRHIRSLLELCLEEFVDVENRTDFSSLHGYFKAYLFLEGEAMAFETSLSNHNRVFLRLILWLFGDSQDFEFEQFKSKLVFLAPHDQILFLRKLFWHAHKGDFKLTAESLNNLTRIDFDIYKINERYSPDIHLDLSVDIVVEAIKSYSKSGAFLFESGLIKLMLKNLDLVREKQFKIQELFENCEGRTIAQWDWRSAKGTLKKETIGVSSHFRIIFEYDSTLVSKVKKLPGRRYSSESKSWIVPICHEEEAISFARENRFFIDMEGSNYRNNAHLVNYERQAAPNGITFCEGRLSKKLDSYLNKKFFWCANEACFEKCETVHEPDQWKSYTLLDFLLILDFNLDAVNRLRDLVEKGKYYQFVSQVNRFERLRDRMYCESCKEIMFPVEDSHFAHYRVTKFHCVNMDCEEARNEVYLHHCRNGKCNNIIDSRRSKQCPNGLYICDNEECGSCCSHEQLSRRLQNLQTTGSFRFDMEIKVAKKLGHLERAKYFCYQCGDAMDEVVRERFHCERCSITYDHTSRNIKRPHRYLNVERHDEN